ncbi:ANTAR domain-containing protein [Paractinoplanes hotanensis]|uniref:ANTAR domain-containing protein n=1 Tax=Paractinoplanes hotanensis TaxID=2906497 RepID=UPI0034DB3F82
MLVEQAKGLLAERLQVDVEQAFRSAFRWLFETGPGKIGAGLFETVSSTAASSSASSVCRRSGTISRSPFAPSQDVSPAPRRTRPCRTREGLLRLDAGSRATPQPHACSQHLAGRRQRARRNARTVRLSLGTPVAVEPAVAADISHHSWISPCLTRPRPAPESG